MSDVTITIRYTSGGEEWSAHYENAIDASRDEGLRHLFDDNLITDCVIERNDKRLAGMPFMTWEAYQSALDRFIRETVVS